MKISVLKAWLRKTTKVTKKLVPLETRIIPNGCDYNGVQKVIGIFDSGLGGLFLLKELNQKFPKQSFIYLADRKNFPYGEKNSSLIYSLVRKNVDFLAAKGVEHIIVACNTASVTLRDIDSYPIPVTGVIEASLRQAEKDSINKKVGLLATPGTVKSQAFLKKAKKLNFNLQIYQQACPLLAPFVEQGGWSTIKKKDIANRSVNRNCQNLSFPSGISVSLREKKEITGTFKPDGYIEKNKELSSLLEKYLKPLINQGVDTVIMGCTHYLYLESAIQKYIGKNKKAVGPTHFLIKDLLEMKKNKRHQKKDKKTLTKEIKNNNIRVFINGQNEDFEKQLRRIWGSQKKDLQVSIETI
ncbi:MAG: aspartate/glutamate racemase family protein [Bdellovibrionales bacterium]|nr:aspartate/glutamate racemase family protein [Bdellovibrionales bacterium]